MMKMLVYAAAVFVMSIGNANAVSPPPLHEGLWQTHTQDVALPGNQKTDSTSEICRSHDFDQYAQSRFKSMKGCTQVSENIEGDTYTVESRCVVGKTVIDGKLVASFQNDTSAHSETHTTFTPAMGGQTGDVMIQDAKYVGSCPAGMQPGDIKYPNGTISHSWKH